MAIQKVNRGDVVEVKSGDHFGIRLPDGTILQVEADGSCATVTRTIRVHKEVKRANDKKVILRKEIETSFFHYVVKDQ